MKINKISEKIFQFTFINEKSPFPLNITVLIEGNSAILIDTAYKRYADQVKEYLFKLGISNFTIFISHHHEDHFDGCKSFPDCKTFASELFGVDFQEHLETDEFLKPFKSDEFLIDGEFYRTENFKVEFIYTPGHNKCEYSFLINDKYLYAGDLIFYDKYGKPSLPYLDGNSNIGEYIESLQRIKELKFQYLLLGHGQYLKSDTEIKKEIENALFYLKNISNSDCEIPLAECLVNDISEYAGLNFHKTNILKK